VPFVAFIKHGSIWDLLLTSNTGFASNIYLAIQQNTTCFKWLLRFISECLSQHRQPKLLLMKVCNQSYVEISMAVSIVRIRPAQLVARGQYDARDAILCCPQWHLKWEKIF